MPARKKAASADDLVAEAEDAEASREEARS